MKQESTYGNTKRDNKIILMREKFRICSLYSNV